MTEKYCVSYKPTPRTVKRKCGLSKARASAGVKALAAILGPDSVSMFKQASKRR